MPATGYIDREIHEAILDATIHVGDDSAYAAQVQCKIDTGAGVDLVVPVDFVAMSDAESVTLVKFQTVSGESFDAFGYSFRVRISEEFDKQVIGFASGDEFLLGLGFFRGRRLTLDVEPHGHIEITSFADL